ncbi:C4-dicarboxylate ABC transporter [Gordonibacter sp. An230]|uniref:TDT family transporter n=1 Tax=Gordonibacter sp. An230 TaxID=1965592 RepID=UPI000B37E726|nr:TDT family transporter [Gordonibacter sp. An230]OUO92491.1 C4-dicarboxylate ABC transporter [Gordonibacter sp. An230]
MRELVKKVPIPIAGVALGLAALGNLLQPSSEVARAACGVLALLLVALLVAKIALFPRLVRTDMRNSIMASVSATLFMAVMQLTTYLAPFLYELAEAVWALAVIAHLALIGWFTTRFMARFSLREVFPTYFICYVGIIVASATAPTFGMESVGHTLFWLGFTCYFAMLVLVTYRYAKHEVPESARPLFCIYTAPMSLSIVGYLATASEPNALFVGMMLTFAQAMFALVLLRLPSLLKLKFYPSYAAMTFPFVITATALGKALAFFQSNGMAIPDVLFALLFVETALATTLVVYVLARYTHFLFRRTETPRAATTSAPSTTSSDTAAFEATIREGGQIARLSESLEH